MSIRKIISKEGLANWELCVWSNGRGSKRIKRRFDKKVDAEDFQRDFKNRQRTIQNSHFDVQNFEETTFAQEAEAWLADIRMRASASHLKRVDGILAEFLPKMGRQTPNQFTPIFLSQLQRQLKSEGARNATVNRKTEVITSILNFATKQRRIPFNPSIGFRKLPPQQPEMLFWEREEAESFLDFTSKRYPQGSEYRWVYVSYLLALNTGLRAGEVWGLQPRDLVDGGQMLFVRRQYNRVTKAFGPPKGKKSRNVPCNETLRSELETLIKTKNVKAEQTIFHGSEGKPVNHDSFGSRRFDKDVERWKGRRIRFHDMRHTAATLMIANGIDLKTVKEICGHKNIATTMNYAHLGLISVDGGMLGVMNG